MIKIFCDRCEAEIKPKAPDILDVMFKNREPEDCGYAKITIHAFPDCNVTKTLHLCGRCYDVIVQALNK